MRKFLIITLSTLFLSFDLVEYSFYQKDDAPSKIKATYIYNFTKLFDWPENKETTFNISILGENPGLVAELTKLSSTRQVGIKKIVVSNVNSVSESVKPDILFISPDKSNSLTEAVSKFKGKGTLLITEKQGLAKVGSVINFIVVENKIQFELNKTSANKAGLNASSTIAKLASKIVD